MNYTITITTDNPDAEAIVRRGTQIITWQLTWGNDYTTSIEAVEGEATFAAAPRYLAGYEMEPGAPDTNVTERNPA